MLKFEDHDGAIEHMQHLIEDAWVAQCRYSCRENMRKSAQRLFVLRLQRG
jgi:hypothetical protein